MGLTSSLYTGLSGLTTNSELISVTGNNIANVNTGGFKASRLTFESQMSQLLSSGSAPNANSGGTNPLQIGMGVRLGDTSRNFNTGNITPTGVNTDLAVEGNGFFMVDFGTGVRYTRAGAFSLDRDFNVTYNGGKVLGYGVDANFQINQQLGPMNIPVGNMTIAEATRNVKMGGNLNAGGAIATQGTQITTQALNVIGGGVATGATNLANLDAGGGVPMFANGDLITVKNAGKGGAILATHTFRVGAPTGNEDAAGTTMQQFMDFLGQHMGIDSSVGSAGITLNGAGQMVVSGNNGTVNELTLDSAHIIRNAGTAPTQPFTMTKNQNANGESVRTTFLSYDSLGNQLNVDFYVALESKADSGTTWRFYVQSEDDTRLTRTLSSGTLSFDPNGQLVSVTNPSFLVHRTDTGAQTPQTITLEFSGGNSTLSALKDTASQLSSLSQDGAAKGTLTDFAVSADGTVVGKFSNSTLRAIGQIVVANFTNPQGLIDEGGNLFSESVNSGSAQILRAGSGGAGRIVGGALELSNVELSQEFINLITASTGFSASSRVLTTSDRLIQELLATVR